jgi:hypothetical protein
VICVSLRMIGFIEKKESGFVWLWKIWGFIFLGSLKLVFKISCMSGLILELAFFWWVFWSLFAIFHESGLIQEMGISGFWVLEAAWLQFFIIPKWIVLLMGCFVFFVVFDGILAGSTNYLYWGVPVCVWVHWSPFCNCSTTEAFVYGNW